MAERTATRRSGADHHDKRRSGLLVFSLILLFKVTLVRILLFNVFDLGKTFVAEFGFLLLLVVVVELVAWRWRTFAFLIVDLLFTALLVALVVFMNYSGRIATYESLGLLSQVPEVQGSVFALLRPAYVVMVLDLLWLAGMLAFRRNRYTAPRASMKKLGFLSGLASFLIVVTVLFAPTSSGADNLLDAESRGLVMFQIDHAIAAANAPGTSIGDIDLQRPSAVTNAADDLKGAGDSGGGQAKYSGLARGRHVFAIQVESLQSFAVGLEVNGEAVTPSLDELRGEAFYFPVTFQQIGAGNTSDCEFMVNTSVYPLESKAIALETGGMEIPALPRLLGARGYQSFTLHANDVSYWNRDEMYPALGFGDYYDVKAFSGGEVIGIGPSDAVLFSRGADIVRERSAESTTPMYASFVTLSSHHPFKLPEQHRSLDLDPGLDATIVGDYLQSIHYVDGEIGAFVDELKAAGLYEESVIVVYGDHFGLQQNDLTETENSQLADLLGHDYNVVDRLTVPVIIAIPGGDEAETFLGTAGQVDIMPTLANLMGLDLSDVPHFGQDLLNTDSNLVGMRYYFETGTYADDEHLYVPQAGSSSVSVFELPSGIPGQVAADAAERSEAVRELERLSDAYVLSLQQ